MCDREHEIWNHKTRGRYAKQSKDGFLTIDEAAQVSGFVHWTIRRRLKAGKLTRYESAGRPIVRHDDLLELVKPKKVREQ